MESIAARGMSRGKGVKYPVLPLVFLSGSRQMRRRRRKAVFRAFTVSMDAAGWMRPFFQGWGIFVWCGAPGEGRILPHQRLMEK